MTTLRVSIVLLLLGGRAARAQEASAPSPPGAEKRDSALAVFLRSGFGIRGAIGNDGGTGQAARAGNFKSDFSRSLEVGLHVPINRYLGLVAGLGYEPLGLVYDSARGGAVGGFTIVEDVAYLQVPARLQLEFAASSESATVRFFVSAGAGLDYAVSKGGNSTIDFMTTTLERSGWYTGFHDLNLAAIAVGGVEVGLGAAPTFYLGVDCSAQVHVFQEWADDAGFGDNNYRYASLRVGLFVKYQSVR
jgi:hypothetical protein